MNDDAYVNGDEKTDDARSHKNTVRAAVRALDILLCFAAADSRLGLTEIARRVDLHKSTVHRLLATLEARGFVRREPESDLYQLGWTILQLAGHVHHSDDMASVALPFMTRLRDDLGETISLYVRSHAERIRIQAVEGTQPVRRAANVGERFPLYIGASGKVLLAYLSPEEFAALETAGVFPPEMALAELHRQLDAVRDRGYAVSREEREVGAAAVSAPVRDRRGNTVAALSVSGPVNRYDDQTVGRFAAACRETADAIARTLA